MREPDTAPSAKFEETLYIADEETVMESYLASKFKHERDGHIFPIHFCRGGKVYDLSHVLFASQQGLMHLPAFCPDIGAP